MSDISQSISLSVQKGGINGSLSHSQSVDMTGQEVHATLQTVGFNAYELLSLGDIDSTGQYRATIKNNDETNYVEVALDNAGTYKFGRIKPGRCVALECWNMTPYVKANVAACQIAVVAAEE